MTYTKKTLAALALSVGILTVSSGIEARAVSMLIEFVPPNDPVGAVTSTNSNDGYVLGRGLVFEMTSSETLLEVGILHDLTNVELSYEIAETTTTSGNVTNGQTILRSGSQVVTTNGLEWIDFAIDPFLLQAGSSYHIEFSHAANGNQNFFYDNQNIAFSQESFASLDGTQFGNTSNFTMPAIRVLIPEPSSLVLAAVALVGIGYRPRQHA